MPMTTSEQDKIMEALAAEHGAVKVLPLRGTTAVLACGWAVDSDSLCAELARGPWWYVPADPATAPAFAHEDEVPLRYATEQEIADALEQDAVRELLSAAGLR
jgi:hypothetical protein